MTDGPFKNLKLDRRSKRFVVAVQNDAEDLETRCALASDAIVHGILRENHLLIQSLKEYVQAAQLDLDHGTVIKALFDARSTSEFADHLQREVDFRLHQGVGTEGAFNNALESALEIYIGEFRTCCFEACLDSHQNGEMRDSQFDLFISGSDEALQNINRARILEALKDGEKCAFQQEARKKQGLDDGPRL